MKEFALETSCLHSALWFSGAASTLFYRWRLVPSHFIDNKETKAREHHDQGLLREAWTLAVLHIPSGTQRHVCRGGTNQAMIPETPGGGQAPSHCQESPCWPLALLLQLLNQGAEPADLPCGQGIKLFLLLQDIPIQPLQLG